jgi:Domain of unknown function (DUF1906)
MTLQGVDYSNGPLSASTMKANNLAFVCRYVSNTPSKNLTSKEVADFKSGAIGIVVVFEDDGQSALKGKSQGATDATTADNQVKALGLDSCPIYFGVDFDPTNDQLLTIGDYLQGVASIIGLKRTGVYGGYATVNFAFEKGYITYGWQTYAWSGNNVDSRCHIYQYLNDAYIGSVNVDKDRTICSDTNYGQANPVPMTWHVTIPGALKQEPNHTCAAVIDEGQPVSLKRGADVAPTGRTAADPVTKEMWTECHLCGPESHVHGWFLSKSLAAGS